MPAESSYSSIVTPNGSLEKMILGSDLAGLYSGIIGGLPVAVYTCNNEGYITYYNDAAVVLWGRRPEIGKDRWNGAWKLYEADGTTALDSAKCPMAVCIREQRKVIGEQVVIETPGSIKKNIMPHPQPVFDADGNMVGAVNTLMDITEIKSVEGQVGMLASIVQSSEDAIVSKTLEGIVTSWNPAAERLFGYTSDEMVGQSITKIIPLDRLMEEPRILERIRRGEKVEHFETKRVGKDGNVLDISLTISPICNDNGKIIGVSKIARDITEQKRVYKDLLENEERLRMASESTHLGTWDFHPQTKQMIWSNECRVIYGFPTDLELKSLDVIKYNHPDDKEYIAEAVARALDPDNDGEFKIEHRIIRYNDQQMRWIRLQGKVTFADRIPERFVGTMLDITEEKKAVQVIKESAELFQTMADNVPAMIWMSGSDKFNDYFNKTWLAFTGRTIEEESNDRWIERVHPQDVRSCINTYKKALIEQKGFYTEYRLLRHDGQYRWISDNCVPRFSSNGDFAGFISACTDIDDQKLYREKILDSEILFKTISNAAPVGLWMTDKAGMNTFVNDTWIRWTGTPQEKQLGYGWLDKVFDEDKVDIPERFAKALASQVKFIAEFRLQSPDGAYRWCLTEGYPYYDSNGEFAGYAGSVTDITEIRKLEQRKDDFIKMASHELKTPITSIKGYVQLLMNIYDELNEEKLQAAKGTVRSSLGTIAKQVTKLTRLISELLDLTRIESGKLELYKTQFDPGVLIEEAVQDVRQTTSRHAIIVHNDFEGTVFADKDRISQVLLNLLTNAVKYSPNAGQVDVYVRGDAHSVTVSVADQGIGIDKKEQTRIFERFYRVEGRSEQTYPGFGIGLFIAAEIIQRHQGTITVESVKDKGSVFSFTIPLHAKNDL